VRHGSLRECWASNDLPPDQDGQCGVFATEIARSGYKCCSLKANLAKDEYLAFQIRRHGHELPVDTLIGYLRRMAAVDMQAMITAARTLLQMHRASMLPEQLRAVEVAIGERDTKTTLDALMHDIRVVLSRAGDLRSLRPEMARHGVECLLDASALCIECDTETLLRRFGFLMCGAELRDALMDLSGEIREQVLIDIVERHGPSLTGDQMDTVEVFIEPRRLVRCNVSDEYRSRVAIVAKRAVVARMRSGSNWQRV
jgi:hypothetical protein